MSPQHNNKLKGVGRHSLIYLVFLSLIILFLIVRQEHLRSAENATSENSSATSFFGAKNASRPGNPPKSQPSPVNTDKTIEYGSGEGQVGIIRGETGQLAAGPESFAVGGDGRVYVADVINHRVLVYSPDGTFLHNIDISETALDDLTVDAKGNLYVFDAAKRTLSQFSNQGLPLNNVALNPADIVSRGYVHVEGESIYFANSANADTLIAYVQNDLLRAADNSAGRDSDGIHSATGKVYAIDVSKGNGIQIGVHDETGTMEDRHFSIPLADVLSARYVGEDENGHFYIQTEKSEGTGVALAVQAFNMQGQSLTTTPISESDYALWTTKLLEVRNDGAIVQFLPEADQAKLSIIGN